MGTPRRSAAKTRLTASRLLHAPKTAFRLLASLLLGLAMLAFPATALAAPGDLDGTFGSDNSGKVQTDFKPRPPGTASVGTGVLLGASGLGATEVDVQADGRIVAIGGGDAFHLARYHADGSPDTTLDQDGKAEHALGTCWPFGCGLAIQADGKIVVAGKLGGDFAVARFNANGSRDATFGVGGLVTTDFGRGLRHRPRRRGPA